MVNVDSVLGPALSSVSVSCRTNPKQEASFSRSLPNCLSSPPAPSSSCSSRPVVSLMNSGLAPAYWSFRGSCPAAQTLNESHRRSKFLGPRRVRAMAKMRSPAEEGTSSESGGKGRRNDGGEGWILDNAKAIRSAPLFFGGASLVAVLLNRSFSGIAAVADASSAQSRADVLAVALSAVVVLTGLVWKSIEPRPQFPVDLDGVDCSRIASGLPIEAARELNWAWEALTEATSTAALVVVYGKTCVLQCGFAAESGDGSPVPVDVAALLQGSLCKTVRATNTQMYLANLALYPGRFELPFLPTNTQAVVIQPLGNDGIMILGSDTLRGFGPSDQGWIVAIGEKLDSTLADTVSSWDRDVAPGRDTSEEPLGTMPSR